MKAEIRKQKAEVSSEMFEDISAFCLLLSAFE